MAATQTVAQRPRSRKSNPISTKAAPAISISEIVPRFGVVTLFGYGIKVYVERGHLILHDGIGDERRTGRFARVKHGLERLVVIGADGMVSLSALNWLAVQQAAFVMLERDGTVLATTSPVRPSDARLRRAQARADLSGAALAISKKIIDRKLTGQERLVRDAFHNAEIAGGIASYREQLPSAENIQQVRQIEAQAAQLYWSVWQNLQVSFPKSDLPKVPEHWRIFDTRRSPLTGSPRHAANPPNAMLNYLYAILEAESRLAIAALGLDPGLGFIHADEKIRDNLACDLMEAARPQVDEFVLDWIRRTPLKRDWFFEQRDGNCRLMASFAEQLAESAPMWRQAVAPLAEWVAQTLWSSITKTAGKIGPATRLTNRRHRESKGGDPFPSSKPSTAPPSVCRTCGSAIKPGGNYCKPCRIAVSTEEVMKAAPLGWAATQGPNAQAQRAETQRRHNAAIKDWDPAGHPAWLTEEAYRHKIQPLLAGVKTSGIASALGVTWAYASEIRKGNKLPHPRHWEKLAKLAGAPA
jgi:CRISPR-associated endonuclease Cas1